MMKTLYVDCFAGIAGDMTVAALLELGLPIDHLRAELARLPLPHTAYRLETERCQRHGIAASRFIVHEAEHQPYRHYTDIAALIEASSLAEPVKERAQRVFFRLAEAEARVHGIDIGQVHFHEVGGIDSIVDIVATAIGLDWLGVTDIVAAPLPWGSGFVEAAHGKLPVPAPATAELLRGLPVHGDIGPGERVTPTGAAIVAALATGFGAPPPMTVERVGYGAGSQDFPDRPNLLRLVLGSRCGEAPYEEIQVLETHIDDMSPELCGFLMERLLAAGALDVAFSPLQMKKNRPAVKLTVLAPPDRLDQLTRLIVTESTAIGVRYYPARRFVLERASEERPTSLGPVRVKVVRDQGTVLRVTPEFDDCRRLALERNLPLMEVYRLVEREAGGR
jgi:uncharacterized protein (TIGR00299 family) protein